jgi:hypothetical protein
MKKKASGIRHQALGIRQEKELRERDARGHSELQG